ncbi:MAG: cytochrome C oxidase subunit IV family protein [Elusimicrobia bacterium]|nr:cytochrome C oxidase subunit IV family protein [Elusimicrobiota bacterium]
MTHHESAYEGGDHAKVYLAVFAALLVLTGVTVGVSRLHLPRALAIGVGLTIAVVKGSLVGAYFMHLISERTIVRSVLGISVVGLFFLIMLPWLDHTGSAGASTQTASVEAAHGAHR